MRGRFTVKATQAGFVALYRLTMDAPPQNLRPPSNVCATNPVEVVTAEEGKRELNPKMLGPSTSMSLCSRSRSASVLSARTVNRVRRCGRSIFGLFVLGARCHLDLLVSCVAWST
jgi:putative SOS response-associated peptidase YedK